MSRMYSIGYQYFDQFDVPLAGGKLFFYETGTTTLADTFSDEALTTPNTNPVILDASGKQPDVFFDGQRRVVITDANDVQQRVLDPVGDDSAVGSINDLTNVNITNVQNEQTLIFNGTTNEWENGEGGGGGGSSNAASAHRYWRLQVTFDAADVAIREMDFFTGGEGFAARQRYVPGTQHDNSTSPPTVTLGTNNTTTIGGSNPLATLVNSANNAAVVFNGGAVGAELLELDFDFGSGNDIAITSFRTTGIDTDRNVTNIKFFYSDDGSTYTQAGNYDDPPLAGGVATDPTPHYALVLDDQATPGADAVFDKSVRTIPDLGIASLVSFWDFQSARLFDFTAESGKHYPVTPGPPFNANITATLPASPQAGDFVGITHANDLFSVIVNFNGRPINGASISTGTIVGTHQNHVALYYVNATTGWVVFHGQIDVAL
ncbi:MAG: hypothetical protein AAF098_13380 [Pseudomonadota bacterium]